MLTEKAAMYSTLGISKEVFAFGTKIEEELKERFSRVLHLLLNTMDEHFYQQCIVLLVCGYCHFIY